MAGYKTHLSIGAVTGLAVAVLTLVWGWVSGFVNVVLIFTVTLFTAFLPDLDSETGKPIKFIFNSYGLVAAALTFYFLLESNDKELLLLLLLPLLVFAIIRFVFSLILNKLTVHRGMFHSIPAALTTFAVLYFLTGAIGCSAECRFAYGFAAFAGYICHLALDEIYSTNILSGEFKPKKSLGTALKFTSKNKRDNIIAYSILLLSALLNVLLAILKYYAPKG